MNSNASHGAKRLACNVIVYNYLASNNFIEVASEFRSSNNIPQKVLDSFKTLTLEGVIRHTIKNPTKLNIEAKTSNKGSRDKQLSKISKSESEKLIKNKSDQLNFETYSRSESKKPSESGQAMLKSKRKFQDEKLAKSENDLFKLNRCSKAESEKGNFTTKPNSTLSSNFEKRNKIDNDLSKSKPTSRCDKDSVTTKPNSTSSSNFEKLNKRDTDLFKSKPTSRYDNDSVTTKLNITSSSNFEKLNKRDNDLSKSKPTSSCDKENLKESNIPKSTITPRSNFGKLNKTDSNTLNYVSKSNAEKRIQKYDQDSDKINMSHSTSKPEGTIPSPVRRLVSKRKLPMPNSGGSDAMAAKCRRTLDLEQNQHTERSKNLLPSKKGPLQLDSNLSQISESMRQDGKRETIQGPKLNHNQQSSKLFSETHGSVKESTTKGPQTPRPKQLSPCSQKLCDNLVLNYLKRNGFEDILNEFKDSGIIGEVRVDTTLEKLVEFCQKNKVLDRSYDSWTTIREGYSDLYDKLNENDTESEVDKVVKYILDVNIPIRYLNAKLKVSWSHNNDIKKQVKKSCPAVLFGHFSKGPNGEEGIIQESWNKLMENAKINNPVKLMKDFMNLNKRKALLRRNVLGCYLAQNLKYIRHGADVYAKAISIVLPWNDGKFTEDDDALILKVVEENGKNAKTWSNLTQLLNRLDRSTIQRRYELISCGKTIEQGKWTKTDYEQFFIAILNHKKSKIASSLNYIQSIPTLVLTEAAERINRCPAHVIFTWTQYIKPILLAYHCGTLNSDWKKLFFRYIIEKRLNSVQEIDWEEVKSLFPCHSPSALVKTFRNFKKDEKENNFYLTIENYLQKTKHISERTNLKLRREEIIYIYDKARWKSQSNDPETAASTPDETSLPTL